MQFFYSSGELIQPGDRVRYHDAPGLVSFIADPETNPDDWYVQQFGGGVMIEQSPLFGRVFLDHPSTDEHLQFIARSGT